jgi:hypothetical protein
MEMKIIEKTFPPFEDLQILGMLFTSHIIPHTTLGNEKCLKLLIGVCYTKERDYLSISTVYISGEIQLYKIIPHQMILMHR